MTTAFADHNFSITDLIGKVRDLVLEHPNTIYEKAEPLHPNDKTWCSYLNGHSSGVGDGCLFGQILPVDFVTEDPQADIYEVLTDHIDLPDEQIHSDEMDLDGVKVRSQEMDWVATVQTYQDLGWTWARAMEHADTRYPLD